MSDVKKMSQEDIERIKDQILVLPWDLKISETEVERIKSLLYKADEQTNWAKIMWLSFGCSDEDEQDIR